MDHLLVQLQYSDEKDTMYCYEIVKQQEEQNAVHGKKYKFNLRTTDHINKCKVSSSILL